MNTSLTAYTHLESLLLFQSLASYGVEPSIFSRISELLKKNPHITSHERFESSRLSPDALRNFYLQILKEEVKSERQDGALDGEGQNGEVRNSRKRKAPSPSLPTVQEAAQHAHLIPQLVTKLYARYRAAITNQIRDDEYRYDKLQKELQEIERGEWDNRIKEKMNGRSPTLRKQSVPKKSPGPQQNPTPPNAGPHPGIPDGIPPANASVNNGQLQDGAPSAVADLQKPPAPENGQIQNERSMNHVTNATPRKKQATLDQVGAPSTPQPLPTPLPPQNRTPQPVAPKFPPPQPANTGYNGSPPNTHRSPYPPQGPQSHGQVPQGPPPSASPTAPHHPQSPPVLPPPSGMQYPVPQPVQNYGENGVPQYGPLPPGPHPQYSPTHQRLPGPYPPPGPQSPGVQTPQQQRNFYSPYSGQPPYPQSQQHPPIAQPPPQGGFMLPPFQVSPQDPSRAHQPPPHYPQVSTPVATRPTSSSSKLGNTAVGSARPNLPPVHPAVMQARGSISTPSGIRTPPSNISTPPSARTIWKPSVKNFVGSPLPRPPVSPIDDIAPALESPKQPKQKIKAPRKSRTKAKAKDKDTEEKVSGPQQAEDLAIEAEGRHGRAGRRPTTRRPRPGSITPSQAGGSVRGRSRSQSVASHTETVSADNESNVGYRVKSERGTSVDIIEEDPVGTPSQPTTSRRRASTLQYIQTNKRKRNAREASIAESEEPGTPGLPKVIAPRHFSRMCNPIMNDIGSHKHASTFTTAVKAKDAEGYYDIIKRPTDLKTIQKAIAAGAKVVAAAASDTPAGSPGGGGGNVVLPLSADVIPPKAIVNSGQLEKELMRMFVNAVMFNAGEEGVVEDAREMFESVQQSVSSWRSAERSTGRLEIEETPVPEEDAPTAPKRRRV
ncbi:hypothetical protein K469DRAFT_721500 [Zopfia rhizophila CBS 207.26]|uniref:Bromo domain-containing protein n=1 Tax=Zopfia rhizophila CBS 207.26 TaxID=1314779 RepID=A0A6A6EHL7_9PEZI|nr:hypothetical protein K469DRAFT_721500 [Zopfia rhizophila CBS 207.26]